MRLARRLWLPLAAGLLLPAASAEPSFDVSVTPAVLRDWRTPVDHRLTITAGATAEHFQLQVDGTRERGPGLTLVGGGAASSIGCVGRRWHTARSESGGSYEVYRVDLEPGQSTYLTTRTGLPGPPWPTDVLGFSAHVSAAEPGAVAPQTALVSGPGPLLRLPRGVPIELSAGRGRAGRISVRGVATGLPAGERIRIRAFAPGATRARLVAVATVGRGGRFGAAFRARRGGVWDVYARYRSALPEFADDASPCSVPVRLAPLP